MATSATAGRPGAHGKQAGAVRQSPLGLCYGTRARSLPSKDEVLQLYRDNGFSKMLLTPTVEASIPLLQAIRTDENARALMQIVLCIEYNDLNSLENSEKARKWYEDYVAENRTFITHICVGNVMGSDEFSVPVFLKAMGNIKLLIRDTDIKLSTVVSKSIIEGSYAADKRPSTCTLTPMYADLFHQLSNLNGSPTPVFVRIMPYFMITDRVKLENCLLKYDASPYLYDGRNSYSEVFDAMLDSFCVALGNAVDVYVVSGWPTIGHNAGATRENAETYLHNLQSRAEKFTPRHKKPAQIYIYSLIDEDMLNLGFEEYRHLGIRTLLPIPNQPQEGTTAINN